MNSIQYFLEWVGCERSPKGAALSQPLFLLPCRISPERVFWGFAQAFLHLVVLDLFFDVQQDVQLGYSTEYP